MQETPATLPQGAIVNVIGDVFFTNPQTRRRNTLRKGARLWVTDAAHKPRTDAIAMARVGDNMGKALLFPLDWFGDLFEPCPTDAAQRAARAARIANIEARRAAFDDWWTRWNATPWANQEALQTLLAERRAMQTLDRFDPWNRGTESELLRQRHYDDWDARFQSATDPAELDALRLERQSIGAR